MRYSFAYALFASALVCAPAAQAAVQITIDKSAQLMTVEKDGRALYQWPVSTGKAGFDTPSGKFKAFRMERDHYSKEWDDAPMPFSIFFTQKGHAIHGSLDTKNIGRPASHGCVRLTPANAEKLFALVEEDGVLNTTVILTGTAPSRAPAVAKLRAPDELDEGSVQPQQPSYGPRYGSNQPAFGNPYYAQPQYALSPITRSRNTASPPTPSRNTCQPPRARSYFDPYGRPYQRPGTCFLTSARRAKAP